MKPGCTFMASLTNGPIRCGWLLMRRDRLCFDHVSRIGSHCFPFFFPTHWVQSQSWLTFYHRSQHWLQHTTLKLFYREWQIQYISNAQPLAPVRPFSFMITPVPTKPRSLPVAFLKEQSIQVLAHSPPPPTPNSPNLAPCDFWLFPLIKRKLAGRTFSRIQGLAKAVNSELHAWSTTSDIKMPLNLGTEDWNCVREAEESTLKECECCK